MPHGVFEERVICLEVIYLKSLEEKSDQLCLEKPWSHIGSFPIFTCSGCHSSIQIMRSNNKSRDLHFFLILNRHKIIPILMGGYQAIKEL